MIVEKIKVYIDGVAEIIKVDLDKKTSRFSAHFPNKVRLIVRDFSFSVPTLQEAQRLVHKVVSEYNNSVKTEERVILISYKTKRAPALNEGTRMSLSWAIADKETMGDHKTYYYVSPDVFNAGQLRRLGNSVQNTSSYVTDGSVIAGDSVEIPYSSEAHELLIFVTEKLDELSRRIQELCSSQEGINVLLNNRKLLLASENDQTI